MAKHSKILAVDLGNTRCLFAEISSGKKLKTYQISTQAATAEKIIRDLKIKFSLKTIQAVVIASVVPKLGNDLRKKIPLHLGLQTVLLGKDLRVPIVNRYRNPKQVGMDRLVNAYAAFRKYRRACVILDFGTAITFDALSSKGEYLGGVIAPGIEISLEALFQKTALLPKIRLKHPRRSVIGRDTVESIRIGCSMGIGGLCDRLTLKLKKALGSKTLVIATGGYARFMKRYCLTIDRIDPDLTLRGIWLTTLSNLDNI